MRYTPINDHLFLFLQLVRDQFTTLASKPFRGFYTVDYLDSVIELHFFVPVSRTSDYEISVNNTDGTTYTLLSQEHKQLYLSWDKKYKVHTFQLTPVMRIFQSAIRGKKVLKVLLF